MRSRILGTRLLNCPQCGEELLDMGWNREVQINEKECTECDLIFQKRKGKRWRMFSIWDDNLV